MESGNTEGKVSHRRFTESEDQMLMYAISKYGSANWNVIARLVPNRNARQCYERWANYLSPFIKRDEWTKEEDAILLQKYQEYQMKWTKIQTFLPGRTVSSIKSRYRKLTKVPKNKYSPNAYQTLQNSQIFAQENNIFPNQTENINQMFQTPAAAPQQVNQLEKPKNIDTDQTFNFFEFPLDDIDFFQFSLNCNE